MILVNREELENRRIKLTIQVEKEIWQDALAKVYERSGGIYPVAGTEHPTRQEIEETYGAEFLYEEAVNETFAPALVEAVTGEHLTVAGRPELEVVTLGPDGYTFSAVLDLYPEVKLTQYKGLSAEWNAPSLTDVERVDAQEDYRRTHPITTEIDCAENGDEVLLDFEGFVDGVPFDGGKGEGYPLTLGSGTFIPGFEEQLIGIKPGEDRDVAVTFPEQYTPELAGKDAVFKVHAQRVVRRTTPKLDDAYAVSQGFADADALRAHIAAEATESKQAAAKAEFEDAIIAKLVENMVVDIPESMIAGQVDTMLMELENNLAGQGMTLDMYLEGIKMSREELQQRARVSALDAVRYDLAMTEVVRLENIEISDDEIARQYAQMAMFYNMDEAALRQQLPQEQLVHNLQLSRAKHIVMENAVRI
ncbi:MAG: trigger factor [Clostridiales bacterium]|nr:trigger factor [Candidatus Cacconaster stercorequi]